MSFAFIGPDPEELRKMQEHNRAHQQDNAHAVRDLLLKLSNDELELLDTMFYNATDNNPYCAWMRGQIKVYRELKHGVCACGEVHDLDADLEKMIGKQKQDKEPEYPGDPGFYVGDSPEPEQVEDAQQRAAREMIEATAPDGQTWADDELIDKYRLWVHPETGHLHCRDCGQPYVSLEDRMVKEPSDCHGCQMIAGQGGRMGPTPEYPNG